MATTGKAAWEKHFQGKGELKTSVKVDSPLYDDDGNRISSVTKGTPITVLSTDEYDNLYPIKYNNKTYRVSFNNINKPVGRRVSGVKLKPQDFETFKTKQEWKTKDLVKSLLEEIPNRVDLEDGLRNYLVDLTKYWGGEQNVRFKSNYNFSSGINEIKKDYGEILGALAVANKDILKKRLRPVSTVLNFPIRGNEPLADYFVETMNKTYTISAKSGTTTNTLKPQDVLQLLKNKNQMMKWDRKDVTKFMKLIVENTTVQFPFQAINFVCGKEVLSKSALEEASKFKLASFNTKKYSKDNFKKLIDLIKIPGNNNPTIGELFFYTEKYIVNMANQKYDPTEIFDAAVSGQVIYVKYDIVTSKQGSFEVLESTASKDLQNKKIKWRSKNSRNRASDKLGLQP